MTHAQPEPGATITRLARGLAALGVALGVMGVSLAATEAAGQIYVDDDAPPGGDGLSWQTAFRSVQQGLDALGHASGAQLRIAGGLYLAPTDYAFGRTGFLAEIDNVASGTVLSIRGGFAGLSDPDDPGRYDPQAFVTLLDGDARQDDDGGNDRYHRDNARQVLRVSARAPIVLEVSGLTIARGRGNDSDYRNLAFGAGIAVNGRIALALTDCTFLDNWGGIGGALSATQGSISGIDCVFTGNRAELGGAIASFGSQRVEFTRSIFRANRARSGGAVALVGVAEPHGNLGFNTCLFDSNTAADLGGAINSISGHVSIGGCTFWNNRDRLGGALFAQGGVVRARGSVFWSESPGAQVQLAGNAFIPAFASFEGSIVSGGEAGLASTAEGVSLTTHQVSGDDPLLADPLGRDGRPASGDEDFNPTTNSPAVNRGSRELPWPYTETDLDGDPRNVGHPDIGAYELLCLADLTGAAEEPNPLFGVPDGRVDDEDYYYFLHFFELGDLRMDLSGSTDSGDPRYNRPDGVVDMTDFFRFLDDLANPCYP